MALRSRPCLVIFAPYILADLDFINVKLMYLEGEAENFAISSNKFEIENSETRLLEFQLHCCLLTKALGGRFPTISKLW